MWLIKLPILSVFRKFVECTVLLKCTEVGRIRALNFGTPVHGSYPKVRLFCPSFRLEELDESFSSAKRVVDYNNIRVVG